MSRAVTSAYFVFEWVNFFVYLYVSKYFVFEYVDFLSHLDTIDVSCLVSSTFWSNEIEWTEHKISIKFKVRKSLLIRT